MLLKNQVVFSEIIKIRHSKMFILWLALVLFSGMCGAAPAGNQMPDAKAVLPSIEDFFDYTYIVFHYADENNKMASTRFSVYQSDELSRHPKYNTTLDTAVFVHGFHNTENTGLVKDMCEGFVLHNKKYNMLTLDWDYFALLDYYEVAAPIIKEYGDFVGEVVHNCSVRNNGFLHPSKLYLIGASLGAHLCGSIGRKLHELSGNKVGRITALDPAGPTFNYNSANAGNCMTANDAAFVDVLHGDAGWYGMNRSMGTCDFWPNNGTRTQLGCAKSNDPVSQSESNVCSHERPVRLFIDSLKNEDITTDFVGAKKHSNGTLSTNESDIAYMGINCHPSTRGDYYLRTSSESPFSLGRDGIKNYS